LRHLPRRSPLDGERILPRTVRVTFGKKTREFEVVEKPYPHILVSSRKELHGWWKGKRECTGERMLANPYNGCSVGCIYCYARALPAAYFRLFNEQGVVTVFKDFDRVVSDQLDSVSVAACGYLSPVCDPFQEIEAIYRLSERIVGEFTRRNIPVEFITRCVVPYRVISLMRKQRHSFGQFSASTLNEGIRSRLMAGGATVRELFGSMSACALEGLPVVLRIDPVIPHLTDSGQELKALIERGIDSGSRHIVSSVMDIPLRMAKEVFAKFRGFGVGLAYDLERTYCESIDGCLHAGIDYRRRIFDILRNLCEARGITFALCMEYERIGDGVAGLNREFMSSVNCEGMDVPLYVRDGERFEPAADCSGACLTCVDARCGVDELAMGGGTDKKDFNLRDYRRWSRDLEGRDGRTKCA
jgi:DNA repair photolyase